jgi:hypothetical protein
MMNRVWRICRNSAGFLSGFGVGQVGLVGAFENVPIGCLPMGFGVDEGVLVR